MVSCLNVRHATLPSITSTSLLTVTFPPHTIHGTLLPILALSVGTEHISSSNMDSGLNYPNVYLIKMREFESNRYVSLIASDVDLSVTFDRLTTFI